MAFLSLGTLCRLGWTTVLSLPLWVKKKHKAPEVQQKMSLLLLLDNQLLRWPELLCSFMKGNSSAGCLKADICYKVQWLWKEQFCEIHEYVRWEDLTHFHMCLLNMYLWSQETFSLAWQKEILVQPQLVACSLVSFRGTATQIVLPFSFSARKRISQNAKLFR